MRAEAIAVTPADLYRRMLSEADACLERIGSPPAIEEFVSLSRKNEAQCALALVQAALTIRKAAADSHGRAR